MVKQKRRRLKIRRKKRILKRRRNALNLSEKTRTIDRLMALGKLPLVITDRSLYEINKLHGTNFKAEIDLLKKNSQTKKLKFWMKAVGIALLPKK